MPVVPQKDKNELVDKVRKNNQIVLSFPRPPERIRLAEKRESIGI